MKRKYLVEITIEIESPEMGDFDPKIHSNYEFIHQNDDRIQNLVKDAFQMTLPQHSIKNTMVSCRETELVLDTSEETKGKEFWEEKDKADDDEYNALRNLAKQHDIDKAFWSVSNITSKLIFNRFGMKVRFVYDNFFTDDEHTEKYYSEVYENPTYLDAWKEFDNAIKHTGDFHHVFLESFVTLQTIDGVTLIEFSSGS